MMVHIQVWCSMPRRCVACSFEIAVNSLHTSSLRKDFCKGKYFQTFGKGKSLLKMKDAESELRYRMTDQHLEGNLWLSTSTILPNVEKLAKDMQHQLAHLQKIYR